MRIKRIVLSRDQRTVEQQELKKTFSPFEVAHFHHTLGCVQYDVHATTRSQTRDTTTSEATPDLETEEELDEAIDKEEARAEEDAKISASQGIPPPFLDREYFLGTSGLLRRFPTWNKLVRVIARILHFNDLLMRGVEATRRAKKLEEKRRATGKKIPINPVRPSRRSPRNLANGRPGQLPRMLEMEDITRSELFLFRLAQALEWSKEIKLLKNREPLQKRHALAIKSAFWDPETSLIRIPGRRPAPDLVALPRHSLIADLFLRSLHLHDNRHLPINELIATAQRRCYIFGGRPAYKKAVYGCSCRNPINLEQQFAELPLLRTEVQTDSYKFCAADYAGPFVVYSNPKSSRGQKCWILLVTCLVTRHLNVEVVEDNTTGAFMRAIRRHISVFGHFTKIFTDNATYFVEAEDQMSKWLKSLNWSDVDTYLTSKQPGCRWHFWTSRASSKAGCIERMVGIFKAALHRAFIDTTTYGMKFKYTPSEFRTIVKECMGLVNHRPLTYVSTDDENALTTEVVVTPNMMVLGRDIEILPQDFRFQKASEFRKVIRATGKLEALNKVYHARQRALEVFWTGFQNQYLEKLKLPRKFFKQFEHDVPVGTFVLLKEPGFKKQKLLPCIVIGVNKRPDGLVNSLVVKCTEYAGPITRDIRAFAMMEADFQKLTGDQAHRIVEHELSSTHLLKEYNIESSNIHHIPLMVDSYSLNLLKIYFDEEPIAH